MHVDLSSQAFPSNNCILQILGLVWLDGGLLTKHKGVHDWDEGGN